MEMMQYHITVEDMNKALTKDERQELRRMLGKIEEYKRDEVEQSVVRLSNK